LIAIDFDAFKQILKTSTYPLDVLKKHNVAVINHTIVVSTRKCFSVKYNRSTGEIYHAGFDLIYSSNIAPFSIFYLTEDIQCILAYLLKTQK